MIAQKLNAKRFYNIRYYYTSGGSENIIKLEMENLKNNILKTRTEQRFCHLVMAIC